MAIIVVELNTDDAGDRTILDAVQRVVADSSLPEVVIPLETVKTKKVKVNPPTPLKIVPEPTGIGAELKAELDAVPDPAQAFADPTAITNPAPPPIENKPAPPPPAPTAVELDVDGLPWDARIHASTKTKIVSGQWKAKRKVSPDTLSIVTEELRNVMSAVSSPVDPATNTIIQDAPAPPAPAPAPIDPNLPTTFETFVVAMVKAGKTNADVEPLLLARNIKGINLLGARPDLIPEIWAELSA